MPPILARLYRKLVRFVPLDTTYILLLLADTEHGLHGFANESVVKCKPVNANSINGLDVDDRFALSNDTLEFMRAENCLAIGAFVENRLVGLSFFATGHVDPKHNRGGSAFRGIGFKLPENVCYLFKVFVLPEFRGKNINKHIILHALEHYANRNINAMITTTDIGNQAYFNSVKGFGFQVTGYASELLFFGKSYFKLPKNIVLNGKDQSDSLLIFVPGQ